MRSTGVVRYEGFQKAPPIESPIPSDLEEAIDLTKYLDALRRRWLLLAATLLIAVSYGVTQYSLTVKQYQATAAIQIERKRLSLIALGQAGWLEDWWNMEYYPTQYRLLRSRVMAERVVQHLRLWENPEFTPRQASLLASAPAQSQETSATELANIAGRIQGGLDIRPIKETQLVELSYRSRSPELAAKIPMPMPKSSSPGASRTAPRPWARHRTS